ncbi:hypothetical protein Tco_0046590 [Tanacetum coccineum]
MVAYLQKSEGSKGFHQIVAYTKLIRRKHNMVAYTKLIKKVKRLEDKLNKSRRKRRLGRKIAHIDDDEGITLVQMGAQTQGRHDHEMEADFEFTTTKDVSTANVPVSTTGAEISTASPKVKTAGVSFDDVAAKDQD